uniref:Uncharacterized protein n=1 Tax=Cacopsylla melanoneura TaxID=428564 RepID=A0A8D8RG86_9HEMI
MSANTSPMQMFFNLGVEFISKVMLGMDGCASAYEHECRERTPDIFFKGAAKSVIINNGRPVWTFGTTENNVKEQKRVFLCCLLVQVHLGILLLKMRTYYHYPKVMTLFQADLILEKEKKKNILEVFNSKF